jgi:hypothetical protein
MFGDAPAQRFIRRYIRRRLVIEGTMIKLRAIPYAILTGGLLVGDGA